MENTEARLNVTFAGENADFPDPVNFDSSDTDVRMWVTEALRSGTLPGIPANPNADLTDFVIDRFAANDVRPTALIQIRPKVPFGR